jgi:DNA-binding CsgD family transcriptional regulator
MQELARLRFFGLFEDAAQRDRVTDALECTLRLAISLDDARIHELVAWAAGLAGIRTSELARGGELDRLGLTRRELDALRRIIAGRSNKEIGVDLGITEKTAEVHVSNVFHKLGVSNRVEATTLAIRLGVAA